jgi:protoporphyrin/coproporphyrin ferrochelatase
VNQQYKSAVLLLAHGSPDRVEEIPEFLRNVTGGRTLPEPLVKEIQHRYGLIGTSPLTRITLQQGKLLARELKLPVYVGMRNWHPLIGDVVKQMQKDGIARAVVICLAPQNSRTSVGLYRDALLGNSGAALFEIDFVDNWHDHPLLIRAFAEKLDAGWKPACDEAGRRVPVIFTAHSVPACTISQGDPYEKQAQETASLVAMRVPALTVDDWAFAFQSQGLSGGAWLGPTVEDTILSLRTKGHRSVFLQPLGFLCDHVEVLYDIDIGFREFASKQGMRLGRAESLNESPMLIAALADVARSRLEPTEAKQQIVQIGGKSR